MSFVSVMSLGACTKRYQRAVRDGATSKQLHAAHRQLILLSAYLDGALDERWVWWTNADANQVWA